jgi:hypothetical protein
MHAARAISGHARRGGYHRPHPERARIIGLFLHEALDPGLPAEINVRAESGVEIDLRIKDKRAEVKTTRDVDASEVPDLIHHWFDDMVASQGDKEAWWLVYFVQRGDGNAQIGKVCMYYMSVIEIPTRNIDDRDEDAIISEAVTLIKKAEKRVKEKDGILEGALLAIDNVVHAGRLPRKVKQGREELQEARAALHASGVTLAEKDAALAEKDAALQARAREIAEFKKRFGQQ